MRIIRKFLAVTLCLVMCLSMLPNRAMAENPESVETVLEETEVEKAVKEQQADSETEKEDLPGTSEEGIPAYSDEEIAISEQALAEPDSPEEGKIVEETDNAKEVADETTQTETGEQVETVSAEPQGQPEEQAAEPEEAVPETESVEEKDQGMPQDNIEPEKAKEETASLLSTVASGSCGPNLTWTLDDKGTLTVSGTGAMNSYIHFNGEGRAPWYSRRNDIKKLVIQKGVTSLGACAFLDCSNMTSAVIPEGIRSLPFQCFKSCGQLTELRLPGTLEKLENESLWNIGIEAFTVPATVTRVDGHFYGDGASQILAEPANPAFVSVDGVLFSKDKKTLIMYPEMKGAEYTVPEGTQIIRGHAFAFSDVLEQIVIPVSVQEIQDYSFHSASNLKTVFYAGNEETWNSVVIREYNEALLNATLNFLGDQFFDVSDPNEYFYEPVYWAVDNGITTGRTSSSFDPYGKCTRGHIVTFLWRAMGEPEPSIDNPFTDVNPSDSFYKAVLWAYENGITTGKTATTFDPWESCTRGQIVTFLWRAKGEPTISGTNPFADVKPGDYFYEAVLWAAKNNITTGKTPTSFAPYSTCTRGQAVTFLYRADGINNGGQTGSLAFAYGQSMD